jgi:protease-4
MLQHVGRAAAIAWVSTAVAVSWLRRGPMPLLRIHLSGALREEAAPPRWRTYLGRGHGDDFFALLSLLRWAREDPDLRGVLITIDRLSAGWACLQGLRRALVLLREAGKQVSVHLTHAGLPEYYLASAAERVVLTPAGTLDVAGLSVEATFFLGALEKLGIEAEVVRMGRYKSAGEPFTRRDMSPENREVIESLVDDLYGQISGEIGASRGLPAARVREVLGRGPYTAREAVETGLTDGTAYLDQVEQAMSEAHAGARPVERDLYGARRGRLVRLRALRQPHGPIAVVHVSGPIKTGESGPGPTSAAGAETLCKELETLAERRDLSAVVLRVNSPGGSGLASDLIWRALVRLREKKPVVVSLGDVAASGGYYIAAAGNPVLAEAGTITGSIGVLAGKATLRGLYDHLGITKEIVRRGDHAAIHSDYLPLGESERSRITAEAQAFYDDFVDKVASGRNLGREAVAAAAEGRVWTGRQAHERGLVDRLGGLDEAISEAKALAGIPLGVPVPILRLPRPRRARLLSLLQMLPGGGSRLELLSPWLGISLGERVWAVMPFLLRFR